jgi:hypothetical protein
MKSPFWTLVSGPLFSEEFPAEDDFGRQVVSVTNISKTLTVTPLHNPPRKLTPGRVQVPFTQASQLAETALRKEGEGKMRKFLELSTRGRKSVDNRLATPPKGSTALTTLT